MPILRHIDFNPPDWGEFGGAPPRVDRAHYQAVLADRPRAFWPLDDAPGTPLLRDAQRHGHDATAVGGVTSGAFAGPHIHDPGDCVDFSGGRLELATLASFGSQLSEGFTFACWLRTSITQSATLLSAVNPNLGTALVFQLNRTGLGNNLPGYIRLIIRDNNGRNLRADLDAAGAVIDNQWHHVAVSYDATTEEVAFYIDGASQSTNYEGQDAPIVTTDFTVPFAIGASSASNGFSNPFIGQLSHASLYDTPLTTSSIAAHTVAGTGPVSAALTQSETAAYPDSPGGPPLGLQGTLGTGNAGVYQSVSLPPSIESTYSRIVIATEALTTGSATMIRAVDTEERPLTWVRLANDQTLTLQTNNGPSTSVELPTSLPWHTIEIAIHASSSTAELRVDGWLAATLPTPAGVSTHRIDVGLMDCRDAAGIIDLDEWVTADTLIGPPVVASTGEFADDPTRWLILYNRNDPDSIAWVEAYRQARGVPLGNLYGVSTSNAEIVDSSTYDQLRAAIDARLAQGTLDQQLIGVLLGPGLPGLVDVDGDATRAWPIVAGLQTNTAATQLNDNPLGVDTPERPTTTNLNGRLLASRIDGDTALSKDLIARSLTVSTSSFDQSNPRLYVDPYGDVASESTHNTPIAAWAKSTKAQSLRLEVLTTTDSQRSFGTLSEDAFYFGYEAGSPTAGFFGESSFRVAFVQIDFLQPPWQTLRTARSTHWPGGALDAGYAATISATSTYSPSHALVIERFFDALERGWTIAEAWHVAQPVLGTPFQLIGDPLMSVEFPRASYRVYGPAASAQQALAEPVSAVLGLATNAWNLPVDASPAGTRGVHVVTAIDSSDRENRSIDAENTISINGGYGLAPLQAWWPRQHGWPLASRGVVRIVWDRRPLDGYIERIQLEQEELGGLTQLVSDVDAKTIRARHLDAPVEAGLIPRRWRWIATSDENTTQATPWSAWVDEASPLPNGPALETKR